jgi:DNA polymerase (family 10)
VERAAGLLAHLRAHPACVAADEAGSLRRRRETVGDLDLIAASHDPAALLAAFAELGRADDGDVTAHGDSKATIVGHDGIQVDLRVVPPDAYGNLLQHFTGSKEHNVALREVAAARGLRVSEWGIEEVETGEVFRSGDEAAVYERLGYSWIPPELRENRGELEAARDGRLPRLVETADIRGDLHAHSTASDGKATVEQMAEAARQRGYGYLAITDHTQAVGMGIGLDAGQIREHAARIREHAAALAPHGFVLLAGVEVDVLADATLDLPDDLLAELDWVVASVHGARGQTREQITARLVAAAEHPHVDVIGHPTGRMLGRRDPYDVDLEAVIAACASHGTFVEINANPNRLDLKPAHARMALDAGVRVLVNTDAHRTATLRLIEYGVAQARRAWATADDVVNTRSWGDLLALRKPGRPAGPRLDG